MESYKRFPPVSSQTILLKVRQSSLQSRCVCAGVTLYVVILVLVAVGFGLMHRKLGYMVHFFLKSLFNGSIDKLLKKKIMISVW